MTEIEQGSPPQVEVDALDQEIRGYQGRAFLICDPCGIIADADPDTAPGGYLPTNSLDETEFSEAAEFHGAVIFSRDYRGGNRVMRIRIPATVESEEIFPVDFFAAVLPLAAA